MNDTIDNLRLLLDKYDLYERLGDEDYGSLYVDLETLVADQMAAYQEQLLEDYESDIADRVAKAVVEARIELYNLYGEPRCENLHHPKKWQHKVLEDCPVEQAIKQLNTDKELNNDWMRLR